MYQPLLESVHSMSRYRRVAACRTVNPVPAKRPRYRESNASRLRQEIKGMTVTGVIRHPRSISSRSNSASESGSPGSKKTTPRNTTPRNMSRQPSKERSADRSKGKEAAPEKEKSQELPRSGSDYVVKDSSVKLPSNTPSELVCVDTRSKTVNNVSPAQPPTAEEVMDIMNHAKPKSSRTNNACRSAGAQETGYGKPLVTPLNRRLTIRRDQPWPSDTTQKRESPCQNASLQRPKMFSTKIPTKVTVSGNRLRESNTSPNVFPDTKIPILRTYLGVKSLRPSCSSIHGRRSNSRSPPRQLKSQEKSGDKTYPSTCNKLRIEQNDPPEIKHWTAERARTPPRSPNRSGSPLTNRLTTAEAKKQATTSNKEVHLVADKPKQPSIKESSATPLTRPNPPVHSNRSFRPQLEDIKSSYLLLNQISQDRTKTVTKAEKYVYNKVSHVVNQFNEERRRHKLTEIKKKFQSSTFFEESRFEKIEGLNWITWK